MNEPVGLFDSGFGGLTIMRELSRLLPHENLIYLGDTANLPYGNKSAEKIIELSIQNAHFLLQKKIKLLIIACYTASSYAMPILQKMLPIPIIGMIEPGLELLQKFQKVAVLATTGTIESEIFQTRLSSSAIVYPQACPLFVPIIEEGFHFHPAAKLIAQHYLEPLKGKIDAALLACTHYPLIFPLIQSILGPDIAILQPAQKCIEHAAATLSNKGLLNLQTKSPSYEFFCSDSIEKFKRLGEIFWGQPIQKVEKNKSL